MPTARALALLALCAAPAYAQTCLFFPTATPGVDLQLGDDECRTLSLPFAFPFNGAAIDQISVCSNGFIWLGVNTNADWTETEAEFLAQMPRIAVAWEDWSPNASGGVFVNATATQVSVLWQGVQAYNTPGLLANMECVLSATGQIDLYFDATMGVPSSPIVGISAGNGAASNAITWTPPPSTIAGATGYELFGAAPFNLAGQMLNLLPISATDYQVLQLPVSPCPPQTTTLAANAAYGLGCGSTGTGMFYERFAGGAIDLSATSWRFTATGAATYSIGPGAGFDPNYSVADALPQTNDSLAAVAFTAMGAFPWRGGALTAASASSNGYVWLAANPVSDPTPSSLELSQRQPRVAPCWSDWDLDPATGGGTFYWTATSTHCMATWADVAAFGLPATQNTFQCKFFANGDIEFSYGAVANTATTSGGLAIVGISGGLGASDLGSRDLTASAGVTVDVTPRFVAPLTLRALSLPQLGASYDLEVLSIPPGTNVGVVVLGLTQLDVDLTGIGAPGCRQLASTDATFVVLTGGAPGFQLPLALPRSAAFVGVDVFAQAASFSAGLNALGVVTSNGLHGSVGL